MSQTHDHRKLRLRIVKWYFYTNLSHIKWTWNIKQYRFSHLHIYLSFCSLLQSCIIIDIYWNIQKTLITYISNHMEMDLYWRADILTRQFYFWCQNKKNYGYFHWYLNAQYLPLYYYSKYICIYFLLNKSFLLYFAKWKYVFMNCIQYKFTLSGNFALFCAILKKKCFS